MADVKPSEPLEPISTNAPLRAGPISTPVTAKRKASDEPRPELGALHLAQLDGARRDTVVLHAPGNEKMAGALAQALGSESTSSKLVCASQLSSDPAALSWDHFPTRDPNLKLRIDAVVDKHVVFLFDMSGRGEAESEMLHLLLFVQSFKLPRPIDAYAKGKWKQTVADGEYDLSAAAAVREHTAPSPPRLAPPHGPRPARPIPTPAARSSPCSSHGIATA